MGVHSQKESQIKGDYKGIKIYPVFHIDVWEDLLDELEQTRKDLLSHESVIAAMEPLKGRKLKDIDKYLTNN